MFLLVVLLLLGACGGEESEERWTRAGRAKKNAALEEARRAKAEAEKILKEAEEAAAKAIKEAKAAQDEASNASEVEEVLDEGAVVGAQKTSVLSSGTEAVNVAGKWDMVFEIPGKPQKRSVLIKQEGAKATAMMGEHEVDIHLDGSAISFEIPQKTPLGTMTIDYKGNVQGDDILGIFRLPRGPLSGQNLQWSAKRN